MPTLIRNFHYSASNKRPFILKGVLLFCLLLTCFIIPVSKADTNEAKFTAWAQKSHFPSRFEASLKIGLPHPQATLVQWTDALMAFQETPEFLYLKGYQPLIPLYFLLKSSEGRFELFMPRFYSVIRGENSGLEKKMDADLKLQAGDILKALAPVQLGSKETVVWEKVPEGEKAVIRDEINHIVRTVTFNPQGQTLRITHYNDQGFPTLDIFRNQFKISAGAEFPSEIRIKRLLPRTNELILNFKEIRPALQLNPVVFSNQFPQDAKYIDL